MNDAEYQMQPEDEAQRPQGRARQRLEARRKRRQTREVMAQRVGPRPQAQAAPPKRFSLPNLPILVSLQRLRIPGGRWLLLIPVSLALLVFAILLIGSFNPRQAVSSINGLWLNADWTYNARPDADMIALGSDLRVNGISNVYAYVSSLKADYTWAGDPARFDRYSEIEPDVRLFVQRLRQVFPGGQIFAWVEVRTDPPTGDRLGDPLLHANVAQFSRNAIESLGFDGVFLDVKPLVRDNDDYLTFLRAVRAELGVAIPIAVSLPPDFTPADETLTVPPQIEPNTALSAQYKQRVALQADQIIITPYNSYRTDPADYSAWVAHQVRSYSEALSQLETDSQLFISLPNYADDPERGHLAVVENISNALAGVQQAETELGDASLLDGVAIFSDTDISDDLWQTFREQWLQ